MEAMLDHRTTHQSGSHLLPGLDVLKVLSAITIFFFHANMHLGAPCGIMTPFINQSAVLMDLFFMVSGFGLMWSKREHISGSSDFGVFYLHRFLKLYPLYLATHILFTLFLDTGTLRDQLLLLPVELTLTQSFLPGLFPYSHNGGTWFISCLAACYLLFPGACLLLKSLSRKAMAVLYGVIYLLAVLCPLITSTYDLPNLYSSPALRFLEFFCGMLLAELFIRQKRSISHKAALCLLLLSTMTMFAAVYALSCAGFMLHSYITYGFATFPLFSIMVWSSVQTAGKMTKFWKKLSPLCYSSFVSQFYVWPTCKNLFEPQLGTWQIYIPAIVSWIVYTGTLFLLIQKPAEHWLKLQPKKI